MSAVKKVEYSLSSDEGCNNTNVLKQAMFSKDPYQDANFNLEISESAQNHNLIEESKS